LAPALLTGATGLTYMAYRQWAIRQGDHAPH